jgi:hypothetical protein
MCRVYLGQFPDIRGGGGICNNNNKSKVKFTLEQAMKAQRGSKGIALLFL